MKRPTFLDLCEANDRMRLAWLDRMRWRWNGSPACAKQQPRDSGHESDLLENRQPLTTRNVTRKEANEVDVPDYGEIGKRRTEALLASIKQYLDSDECQQMKAGILADAFTKRLARQLRHCKPDQGDTVDVDALGCRMCGAARGQPHKGCILR